MVLGHAANGDEETVRARDLKHLNLARGSVLGRGRCQDGKVRKYWPCNQVDLLARVGFEQLHSPFPVGDSSGTKEYANDVWGWTDPATGVEYALVGTIEGTVFVDLSNPEVPVVVGALPPSTHRSAWRDIKVVNDHAVIVADAAGDHGMQVFDLSNLGKVADPPVLFEATVLYDGIASAHNVVVNDENDHVYVVGMSGRQRVPTGSTCGRGLHVVDMSDPADPRFAGCSNPSLGRSYTHDAQCVRYRGLDQDYVGRDLCFESVEDGLVITDVTDPAAPREIGALAYPMVSYAHQGWLTEDQRYFLMDDERDEYSGAVNRTRTLVFDLEDLDDPQYIGAYEGPTAGTDHNLYIRGHLVYQANYAAGLRILQLNYEDALQPHFIQEVGYFDVLPFDESPGTWGAWSNYPYFESGIVILTSTDAGLYVLQPTLYDTMAAEYVPDGPHPFVVDLYPNPVASSARVTVRIEEASRVRIDVLDLIGRRVGSLQDGLLAPGRHEFVLASEQLSNGVYYMRVSGDMTAEVVPFVLQR